MMRIHPDLISARDCVSQTPRLRLRVGQDWVWNLNDCKLTSHSLKHLSSIAGKPTYALRSHSSANWRSCIRGKSLEGLEAGHDKSLQSYSDEFFQSCYLTGASTAIPFASNVACLHRDTFQYNKILNFSDYVDRDFSDCSEDFVEYVRCSWFCQVKSLDVESGCLLSENDSFRAVDRRLGSGNTAEGLSRHLGGFAF